MWPELNCWPVINRFVKRLLCRGIENKTTAGHSGSGKDPRVTARERETGKILLDCETGSESVASDWVFTSLTSYRGCFDQWVGLNCPVNIIMDTEWLSRTPAGENSASTVTRGPNWLLMRIKSVCSKEVRRGVINRNCFIMFWRLTFNGPGLCFLCLDNCQKSDGVRLLITLVLLQPKCSENRFTVRLASPPRPHEQTPVQFLSRKFPPHRPIQPIYLGSWTFTQISNMARTQCIMWCVNK